MPGRPHSRRKQKALGRPNGIGVLNILALSRLNMGLSQKEIADATNCSQSYVSKVEKGRDPDAMYLYKFAKATGIRSIGEFFEAYAEEQLNRISQIVKTTQAKHQSVLKEEADIGESEPSSPPPAPSNSPTDQRLDADSETQTS